MERDSTDFEGRPWAEVKLGAYDGIKRVPTMLAPDEERFYIWLTEHWATGFGAVVDLGAFVGGSTARLAAGAAKAGKDIQIHAYDKFTAKPSTKETELYAKGIAPFEGDDILPLAQQLLSDWSGMLRFHKGNIEELPWTGGPIEILAIDVFKKVALTDAMVATFFPSLVPGRSLVLQQDFLHWSQPWLAAQMARFGDVFEPVAFARRDTIAYLLRKPITPEVLAKARIADVTDAEMQTAIADAKARFANWGISNRFDEMAAGLAANPGVRISWQMKRP